MIDLNGTCNSPPLPNLNAELANAPIPLSNNLNPRLMATIVPPTINNCFCRVFFNSLNKSVLLSELALIILTTVFVNQPPANIKKKSVNLANPNCVFCANLLTGNVSAD